MEQTEIKIKGRAYEIVNNKFGTSIVSKQTGKEYTLCELVSYLAPMQIKFDIVAVMTVDSESDEWTFVDYTYGATHPGACLHWACQIVDRYENN